MGCPYCGGALSALDDSGDYECIDCGAEIFVEEDEELEDDADFDFDSDD